MKTLNEKLLSEYKIGMIVTINRRPSSWSHIGAEKKSELIAAITLPIEIFPITVKIKELEDYDSFNPHVPMEAVNLKTKQLIGFNLTDLVKSDNIKKVQNINSF